MSAAGTFPQTERRRFPRFPFKQDVGFMWAGRRLNGLGRDVSGSGISFLVDGGSWAKSVTRGFLLAVGCGSFLTSPRKRVLVIR